jgi:hypothetical protein
MVSSGSNGFQVLCTGGGIVVVVVVVVVGWRR